MTKLAAYDFHGDEIILGGEGLSLSLLPKAFNERVRSRKSRRESELTPDETSSVRAILRSARKGS